VQSIHKKNIYRKAGFTLVEVVVALALLGILVVMATGLLVPLSVTNQSNDESRAAAIARSYIEVLKARWQVRSNFITSPYNIPTIGTSGDIKTPTDWTITINSSTWKAEDTLRTVVLTVTPKASNSKPVVLEVLISRPS
jgi:prepilin-type N-terminal cleavage/methylation domain-containing protein